jgi:hypothetical protein
MITTCSAHRGVARRRVISVAEEHLQSAAGVGSGRAPEVERRRASGRVDASHRGRRRERDRQWEPTPTLSDDGRAPAAIEEGFAELVARV